MTATKAELIAAADAAGITLDGSETKAQIVAKLEDADATVPDGSDPNICPVCSKEHAFSILNPVELRQNKMPLPEGFPGGVSARVYVCPSSANGYAFTAAE